MKKKVHCQQLSKIDSVKCFTRVILLSKQERAWSIPHTQGGVSLYFPVRSAVTFNLLRGGWETLSIELRIGLLKLCGVCGVGRDVINLQVITAKPYIVL